jgi:hypothetical protein
MSVLPIFFDLLNADQDPFRIHPENLRQLQLQAIRERFAQRRSQVRVLGKRAADLGLAEIRTEAELVPLLFAHQTYKTYPENFIDAGKWGHLNVWLQTLCARPIVNADLSNVRDVDDWMERLREVGHCVFSSSGTSGKCSFISQTKGDLDNVTTSCVKLGVYGNELIERDRGRRHIFLMLPPRGAHRHVEPSIKAGDVLGRDVTLMFTEPSTANDSIRMGRMRRAIADGSAKPSEIAQFQRTAEERQLRTGAMIDAFLEKLIAHADAPVLVQGNWSLHWSLLEQARRRGVGDAICHPETVITAGGGLKGTRVPVDYMRQILRFYGISEHNVQNSYGMSEMIGTGPWSHTAQAFAICPWIVPLILDKSGEHLLNPEDGKGVVEGRFAFFDLLAEGYWGGIITGDKVVVDFSPTGETGGLQGPLVRSVARYADLEEGEDKLSCAGTMESYVRGMIEVS